VTLTGQLVDTVIALGEVALRFGRVDRITYHPDGRRPETDTDHTVMLGLVGCALAPLVRADLNVGLVAEYALIHDLPEVYAGDTPTLAILIPEQKAAKVRRELAAVARLGAEFEALPWLPARIAEYEAQMTPEARYVRALDKCMPKITHVLNNLATVRAQGHTRAEIGARYEQQAEELRGYAADFPVLLDLYDALVARELALFEREGIRG
jgi:putative hydrolases of HD superfamily